MNQEQFIIHDHKKPVRLKPEQVLFYEQGEIIEAISEHNEIYYLFFYKYDFLTLVKAKRIRCQSYIEHAFKKGMVFNSRHPFVQKLLSSNHPLQMISTTQLFRKLATHYTPQEKAYILTFFESFISKKQLFKEIKSIFREYRHNGQLFLGYRIIRILKDFAPDHSLVKSLANELIYNKYAIQYDKKSGDLLKKDLIFAEKALYSDRGNKQSFQQLVSHLEKESRWFDLVALYSCKLTSSPSEEYYSSLIKLLKEHFTEDEMILILEELSCQIPAYLPLQRDLFNRYVQHQKINEVFKMMMNHHFEPSHSQMPTIAKMLEDLNVEVQTIDPEMLTTILMPVFDLYPEKAENLLNKFVRYLIKFHEIAFIQQKLKPFKEKYKSLPIFNKLETMQRLDEDLDQMQTLGEFYYEFRRLDMAIECFSLEMELKPSDPKPLQWLSKVYLEMGMNNESNAYQQLCINLQKQA